MSSEQPVAYILGTFPQPSQTFIAREIRGLKHAGLPLALFALARRTPEALEEPDRAWYGDVRFAPAAIAPRAIAANLHYLSRSPGRYLKTLALLLALPHRPRVLAVRAVLLMMTGAWIAREIERSGGCRQVHAHFALAQTEVAMAVSALLGCPFSFTAHARDIYATPSALEAKIRAAAVVVTCTAYNVTHLRGLCPDLPPAHVRLVHHGVDLAAASAVAPPRARGGQSDHAATILAAGRLIEKKGFDTLIAACALLRDRHLPVRCRIYGTGPLRASLDDQIGRLQLRDQVELPGWAPPGVLLDEMAVAGVFVMPSRVSRGGDRDGIPNVVLEAMAASLPVIATKVSGIPEAVVHGETGLLVAPDDPAELAEALARLLTDGALAARFGLAARTRVAEEFILEVASRRLIEIFRGPELR
ncbi:MAG TPA: glycosyltransferase family 4 protein [Vicinamibacterales bacterium]|nr:glycosyltransferase family 4 protein [Vicinamibacterales bacterium]